MRLVTMSIVDVSAKSDVQLARARLQRIVAIMVFSAFLVIGIVLIAVSSANAWIYLGIALTSLGTINAAISSGGLWRVLDEQETRRIERDVKARRAKADVRPPWEFRDE